MSLIRTAGKLIFATADRFLPNPTGPRILIYHQVDAGLGRQMEVTLADFERQMGWLAANRRVVDLDTALAEWTHPEANQLVVLTFDDGYHDIYSHAYPILTEHGLPFLVYLATESIETGSSLGPATGAEPLSWDHVGEMMRGGLVSVGAHTHSHRDLRHATRGEAEDEISTSNQLIRDRLGVVPDHFAYPWGYWSESADQVVRDRYRSAVLAGTPRPVAHPDPYLIHRYPVQLSDSFKFFRSRLEGGLRLEESLRRRISGYTGP
ncbi:MAG: polysaccharide deacetylase family protein [Acidimicrobiia bacterium]